MFGFVNVVGASLQEGTRTAQAYAAKTKAAAKKSSDKKAAQTQLR